jgi:hypothetical protein
LTPVETTNPGGILLLTGVETTNPSGISLLTGVKTTNPGGILLLTGVKTVVRRGLPVFKDLAARIPFFLHVCFFSLPLRSQIKENQENKKLKI